MRKLLLLPATATGLAVMAVMTPAGAAPKTVTAVTHSSNHPDTTSVSGSCTVDSPGGPVWAYDNLSLKFSVTPTGDPNTYSVTITANGSFSAFADPNTGACLTTRGSVDGSLSEVVSSATAPDPSNLPAQSDGSLSQGALLNQLFGSSTTFVSGGHYSYTYNRIDGGKYTQVG